MNRRFFASLRLFGSPTLEGPNGPLSGRTAQRHRLALLALLAASPDRSMSREKLVALLWPESDDARGRNLLNVSLYTLRKALGEEALLSRGNEICLETGLVEVDVVEFERALEAGDLDRARSLYAGPFLDGFFLDDALEFEEWAAARREAYARRFRDALESLATTAEDRDAWVEAERLWRRLSEEDPYAARPVLRRMRALSAVGDRGRALELAREHARRMREEFAADPDPEVEAFAAALSETPPRHAETTFTAPSSDRIEAPVAISRAAHSSGPSRLRQAALLGAVGLVGLVAILSLLPRRGAGADVDRVAALSFENRTGDPALDPLGPLTADWIAQGIATSGLIQVVPGSTVARVSASLSDDGVPGDRLLALARETDANLVIVGEIHARGDSLVVRSRLIDPVDGSIVRGVDPVAFAAGSHLDGLEVVRERVIGALATVLDERLESWTAAASKPPSLESYHLYSEGLSSFFHLDYAVAADRFGRAYASDTTFTVPLVWQVFAVRNPGDFEAADSLVRYLEARLDRLAPWDRAMTVYHAAFNERDWEAAYDAAGRVVEIAPGSDWMYLQANMASRSNRPARVVEILTGLDPDRGWLKRWAPYWGVLIEARHRLGDHSGELDDVERARARFPDSFVDEAVLALAENRRLDQAERTFDTLLTHPIGEPRAEAFLLMAIRRHVDREFSVRLADRAIRAHRNRPPGPDSDRSRVALGFLLYTAERWEESRSVFEAMERESPESWQSGPLGALAARRGDRDEAERRLKILAADSSAERHFRTFDRARIAALLGEEDRAVTLLREAYVAGLPFNSFQADQMDFESLRGHPSFVELVRPKR